MMPSAVKLLLRRHVIENNCILCTLLKLINTDFERNVFLLLFYINS